MSVLETPFPTAISRAVFYNKYSRWDHELKRRETKPEAIGRAFTFLDERFIELGGVWAPEERALVESSMHKLEALPSMRLLWSAGPALKRNHITAFNCSALVVNSLRKFAETLYILMCGTGVGYSVEAQYVSDLPKIKRQKPGLIETFVIPDTTEGWADALNAGIESWWNGHDIQFDGSQVRPAGAILKIKGGRASGVQPLLNSLQSIRAIILKGQGRNPTPLMCHDIMCLIAQVVVVGGIRRSSLISLFDVDDMEMRMAKNGEFWNATPWRAMSNNSIAYNEKPSNEQLLSIWASMIAGHSGEPGIYNRQSFRSTAPRRTKYRDVLTNPCQPASASVITKDGLRAFGDISVGDVIWSETGWTTVVRKESSGVKPTYKYGTTGGSFYGTENHRIVSAGKKIEVGLSHSIDLLSGPDPANIVLDLQHVVDGLVLGDGTKHGRERDKRVLLCIGKNDESYFHSEVQSYIGVEYSKPGVHKIQTEISADEVPVTFLREVPLRYTVSPSVAAGFLRGLYSANGSVVSNRVTLKTASAKLREQVQLMLSSLGIRSYYTTNRAGIVKFGNGEYVCKESYDINISTDRAKFASYIGFIQPYKNEKLDMSIKHSACATRAAKNTYEITEVVYLGEQEVFDITVDNETHTYWTGGVNASNCGEIQLRDSQFCNLSESVARADDNLDDLIRKTRASVIIGTIQASLTDFPYIDKKWKENTEEEALLGVSVTGQMDCPAFRDAQVQRRLREVAIEVNRDFAQRIGVRQSAAITTGKPSGTLSLFVDASSGCHTRWSKFGIRRIRLNSGDPMLALFRAMGLVVNVDPVTPNTFVVDFPFKAPDGAITRHDLSAMQQLEHWLSVKTNYTEHNQSATIYVKDDEWIQVVAWIDRNWNLISGLSFLPTSDHVYPLAPFEEITEEQYLKLMETFPVFTDEEFAASLAAIESEDNTVGASEAACMSGQCDVN